MTADAFLELAAQALYLGLAVLTALGAVRRPGRAAVDAALFFGAAGLIVVATWALHELGMPASPAVDVGVTALLLAMPYLFLRVVDDLTPVSVRVLRTAAVGLAAGIASIAALQPLPGWAGGLLAAYCVGTLAVGAVLVVRAARTANGVTRTT